MGDHQPHFDYEIIKEYCGAKSLRIAVLSVHGCPLARGGRKDAGGMNVYVLETSQRFTERGAQVDVFVPIGQQARVVHMSVGSPSDDKQDLFVHIPDFVHAVEEFRLSEAVNYDLVVSHYWLSGLAGLDLSAEWDVPHVTSFHTLAEVKFRARPGEREAPERVASERRIAREVDRIVAWSQNEQRSLTTLYGAQTSRVEVIPPGVDTSKFIPMDSLESRQKLGLGLGRNILYVGRLDKLKGLDILLRAVAGLEDMPDVRLMVVGGTVGDQETTDLRTLARELGIETRVDFLGSVDQALLPRYYAASDVCVLPSHYESFGLAALEAAACEKPVVASNVGGLPSIVLSGETGYLISWQCPGPFATCIELLLENHYLRRSLGRAARKHATTLTWDASVDALMLLYESLVSDRLPSLTVA